MLLCGRHLFVLRVLVLVASLISLSWPDSILVYLVERWCNSRTKVAETMDGWMSWSWGLGGSREHQRLLSGLAGVLGDVRSTYTGRLMRWRHVHRGDIKSFLCDGQRRFGRGHIGVTHQRCCSPHGFLPAPPPSRLLPKNCTLCSLFKQTTSRGGFGFIPPLLLNKHVAAKFTVLFLYNLGVNMSAHATNLKACRWNKLQIFVRGIKRGLRRRQHVLKQILAKMLCRRILLIDAVLFPF